MAKAANRSVPAADDPLKDAHGSGKDEPKFPPGWKGKRPNFDVQSLLDLLQYFESRASEVERLRADYVLKSIVLNPFADARILWNEAVFNAYRCVLHWKIRGAPPMPSLPFATGGEADAFVTNFMMWLHERLVGGNQTAGTNVRTSQVSGRRPSKNPTGGKRLSKAPVRGPVQEKLLAALEHHHQHDEGRCQNLEPIGVRELASKVSAYPASADLFFKKHFGGHSAYEKSCFDGTLSAFIEQAKGKSPMVKLIQTRGRSLEPKIQGGRRDNQKSKFRDNVD